MIRSFFYSTKQAFKQIGRNKSMAFTSLFSITAMLLILGLFFILVVNVNLLTESAKDQFDTVEIFILDSATQEDISAMQADIEGQPYVSGVKYLSKEDAMTEMQGRWGDNAYLLEGLSENPLPRSLRITLDEVEDADSLVKYADKFSCIEDVKYNKTEVEKILKITNTIQIGALVIIAFLIIVSIVVVSNTVKLTVLARGREISIMKYVGATNWFIRGPFLAEGIIIGVLSAVISSALISGLYLLLTKGLSQQVLVLFSAGLYPVMSMSVNLMIIFLALGVSIGAMGSIISMRRFLDT
ncbi:MAG: permease-like cell division protein FtsX [Firmicutes bacterium]|nr:permease-like cell division protein FtsX [Bacillota bacterium]